ncbi:hypothetical protein P0136_05505 [Lentisphaerota bacterium ZTH]|nr:hypothetical protein JYG24_03380 [Lentisphaerota bacterium]WET07447.1 hypothetical protein P0136_05505 [Lentisphaerota bacterium ZTH]
MYICKVCNAEFRTSRHALKEVLHHSCVQARGLRVIEHKAELLPDKDSYKNIIAYRLYDTDISGLKKNLASGLPAQAPTSGGKHKKFSREEGLVYAASRKGLSDFPKEDAFKDSILRLSTDDILPGNIFFSFQNELSRQEQQSAAGSRPWQQPGRYRRVSIYEGSTTLGVHVERFPEAYSFSNQMHFYRARAEITRIIHQLVYIHYCMYKAHLMHGDLHLHNIKYFQDNNQFPIIKAFDFGNSKTDCTGSDRFRDLQYFCARKAAGGKVETFVRNKWRNDASATQQKHYPLHRLSMFLLNGKFSKSDVYARIRDYGAALMAVLKMVPARQQNASMLFEAFSNDIVSLFYTRKAVTNQQQDEVPQGFLCFKDLSQYHSMTNRNYSARLSVRKTKNVFKKMLSTRGSDLRRHICTLSEAERRDLLTNVFSGECRRLQNALLKHEIALQLFKKENLSEGDLQTLSRLGEHDRKDGKYLNSTMLMLANAVCRDNNDNERCEYDMIQFMRQLLKSIPDEVMHPNRKRGILLQFNKKLSRSISDLTFYEPAKYISESARPDSIPLKKYNTLVRAADLNDSEFIILTVGVLKNFLNNPGYATKIINLYYEYEYAEAKKEIRQILQHHRNYFPRQLCEALSFGLENSRTVTNKCLNSTRRYFETRLAQYHLGHDMNLRLVNDVISVYSRMRLTAREQAEQAILTWSDSEKHEKYVRLFYERKLKKASELYPIKDRAVKSGFLTKRDLSRRGQASQAVMSHQRGLMTTKDPYFRDEITSRAQVNRIPDIYTHSFQEGMYPMQRSNAVYSASLSGHMYFVVGLLEKFMSKYTSFGQDAVNEFLLATIAVYAKNGFHSNYEILDVLHEPHIIKRFGSYGINLNLHFKPYALNCALRDTLAYTSQYTTKRVTIKELTSSVERIPAAV